MALLKFKFGNAEKLVRFVPPFKQEWTEDENVTTSLGHRIPVEECGIEMGLQSASEMPFTHTIEESCGVEMGLISVEEIV